MKLWPGVLLMLCFAGLLAGSFFGWRARAAFQDLSVTAGYDPANPVAPGEQIELRLSRPLQPSEGRLAILVGQTDLSSLFVTAAESVRYHAATLPLPPGETEIAVYLVAPDDEWTEIARIPLRVAAQPALLDAPTPDAQAPRAKAGRRFGFDKFDIAPSLNLGLKSQFAETHFPEANRPARPTFRDATIQGSLKTEMARGSFQLQSQFDLAGSSARNEALRFAALGEDAPKVDLANYQAQLQHGSRRFLAGHSTFGAHRHLVNNFASRGLALTVPLGARADVSLAAMNTTNIVGWDNFSGLANRRHRMFGGVLGFEVFKSRPGGLRFEAGALDAWFQPRTNFNQGNINDAERSQGLSARVLAKDKSERARLDAGFTRSRFVNANDPLLVQNTGGASVVPARQVTRGARYADASFDLLKEFAFQKTAEQAVQDAGNAQAAIEPKKFNLTLNLRHERVDPLFKSIGASTQADLHQNQVELVGNFGEANFNAAYTRFNDNLAGIQTILRTGARRNSFAVNAPLQGLFSNRPVAQPNAFFPRIGYAWERVRAAAGFVPLGGGFDAPGAIPDQANTVQSFVAEWQFKEMRLGYRLNHSLQDNRAAGRERADLQNFVHNATFGWTPMATLSLDVEVNLEDASNREQISTDRTLRFGFIANWQATRRQSLNATFSTIGAGGFVERARNSNSRNLELDLQWNYRLARESENRFRKFQAIYFIRYSNRFARARNLAESVNALTKLQTFNTGVNFIFF